MAKRRTHKSVEVLTHDAATRRNIPTAEHEPVMAQDDRCPVEVAYERRNRDLDPQLVWRGKDEQNWSDLVVPAPPLFIQEKVHPKALINDLLRHSKTAEAERLARESGFQVDLFADFNGLPSEDARTEFYQHDANWSNRIILGDSLQVMASLAEREGLRGKVQCIYLDPALRHQVQLELPVVHDEPGREGRQGGACQPRAGAGEGVSGYVEGRDSLVFDVSARSIGGGARFVVGKWFRLCADWR